MWAVMCPLLMLWYPCWCILLGNFCVSTFSFGPGQHGGGGIWSGNELHNSGSISSNHSRSGISSYAKTLKFSLPLNSSVSCEDLEGVGSFDTTCLVNSNLYLNSDLYIYGTGNLEILPHVSIACPIEGCMVTINMTGNVNIGQYATIVAGSVVFAVANLTMDSHSSINTTALGGSPPPQTSGTPVGEDGGGGGHGGRGASCLKRNKTSNWGGDVYAWSTLAEPWSYGSKGGGTSSRNKFGGNGGGRIKIQVKEIVCLNGSIAAEGGDGGLIGGGGSGGSIFVHAVKL